MPTIDIEHPRQKSQDFVFQPKGFDPDDFPGPIKKHPDAARWFLNCIHFRRVTRHFGHDEYVNLHSGLLSLVMGKTELVKPIRETLIHHGLIETDDIWSLGKKSLGYRLGPELKGCRWERYYSTNKRFQKRLSKFKEHVTTPKGLTHPAHLHLAHWVKQIDIHPDYQIAVDSLPEDKRDFPQMQVDAIRQGLIHTTVCPYGRFHSNFSSLSRVVRPYLTINGQPLAEIDLVNSQPYFLSIILLEIALSQSHHNVNALSDLVFDSLLRIASERGQKEREEREGLYVFPFRNPPEEHREKREGEKERKGLYVFPFEETVFHKL